MNATLENKPITGIKSVSFYRDGAGCTCDRCGTFIKNVTLVEMKDGSRQRIGSECINKVMSGDNSLKKLYSKNAALLKRWVRTLEILSLPVEEMPIDQRGYYGRGFYFIADDEGKALSFRRSFFHPTKVDQKAIDQMDGSNTFDMRPYGGCWEAFTLENWSKKCVGSIESAKVELKAEIERISGFLARVLAKGLIS